MPRKAGKPSKKKPAKKPVKRSLKWREEKKENSGDVEEPIAEKTPERLLLEKREKQKKEDFAIIGRAINGDERAYKDLMTRYQSQIFSLMYRMVHSSTEAEDLVQEAFMKAFTSLRSFNYEYAFSTWLYKIATNNCIDHLRKKKLHAFSIDTPISYKDSTYTIEIPDLTYYPDKDIMRNERNALIKTAIEELPEKYKRVIFLRHSEELSYEEISKMLKIPIGTVKARIFRAREMLNRFLKGKVDRGN